MLILADNYSSNSTCHPSNCVFFLFLLCFETVFWLFLFREACEMFRFFLLPNKDKAQTPWSFVWIQTYSTSNTYTDIIIAFLAFCTSDKMNKTQTDLYRTLLPRYRCNFDCYYSDLYSSSLQIRGFHSSVRELCHETQSVGLAVLTPYSLWDEGFRLLSPLGKTFFSHGEIQQRSNQLCPWFNNWHSNNV